MPVSHDGVLRVLAVEGNTRRQLRADAHRYLDLVLAEVREAEPPLGEPTLTL